MTRPITVSDSNFEQAVLKSGATVLVDFWASWCKPCLMIAPVLEEVAEEYNGKMTVAKIDVDQNPVTAVRYNIMSIPTLIIFKQGEPISHLVGYRPKRELKQALDAALS